MKQVVEFAESNKPKFNYGFNYEIKDFLKQKKILKSYFPDLIITAVSLPDDYGYKLPKECEGWFAIPEPSKIAPTYEGAMSEVLRRLEKSRSGVFHDFLMGKLGADRLRQCPRTTVMLGRVAQRQGGPGILAVPAQFGLAHSGLSPKQALAALGDREFGLGSFAVAIMLLTHPKRLKAVSNLGLYCIGDEHTDKAIPGLYSDVTAFSHDGRLNFYRVSRTSEHSHMGSVTGFMPFPFDNRDMI